MDAKRLWCIVAAAVAPATAALAESEGIHIKEGRSVGWYWTETDGAGYRWDISSNGQVNDGSNDAYDGGMNLTVNGSSFYWSSSGRLNKAGDEVEIGPWTQQDAVRVWRRIHIDKKVGYCRWIDIFENASGADQSISLRYYSNMGGPTRMTHTTSGKADPTKRDWGIVTAYSDTSSRPAVVHIFASKGAKTKPRFQYTANSDGIYYHMNLTVPAGKSVALCLINAQRRPYAAAKKFLTSFNVGKELARVPAPLRRIIINMGGAVLQLGRLELPRHEKHDLAVLPNGDELLGTILSERYVIETFYGKLELPAERAVGLCVPDQDDPQVHLGLVDGQVIGGTLRSSPLKFRLTNGDEMSLEATKLKSLAYRLSPGRPDEITLSRPAVVLRDGQRLFFALEDANSVYHTEHGNVKLRAADLRALHFHTPDGGLHRAVFQNGSVLAGMLVGEGLTLRLDLGPRLEINRHKVFELIMPPSEQLSGHLAEISLRNEDQLFGRIVSKSLSIRTSSGTVVLEPSEIARIEFQPGPFGRVQVKLQKGTTITGRIEGDTIRVQIDPGPQLDLFVGHIVEVTMPKVEAEAEASEEEGTEAPTTRPADPATGEAPRRQLE
jgi:hypothetical protein